MLGSKALARDKMPLKRKFMMFKRHTRNLSLPSIMGCLLIAAGLFLRTRQYIVARSLWLDEAMLALNIVNRSFVELTQPLDYNQGAPIGFLLLQKLIIQNLGNKDYILRLFPFIAGIAAIFIMHNVAKKYIGSRGSLIATGLFVISVPLIYYASEAKQYSSDVFASLLLLFLAHRCISADSTFKHFFVLGLVGALSIYMSHPALLVIMGIGFSLTVDMFFRKDRQRLLWVGIILLFWLINFITLYFISLRSLASNEALINYWSSIFMPIPPWSNIEWFIKTFSTMLINPVGLGSNMAIIAILTVLGCSSLFIENWPSALLLTMPFFTTLLASGFEKYPFQDRLLLFIVPMVLLLLAEGLERLYLLVRKYNTSIAIGVCVIIGALIMYKPMETAFQNLKTPNMREHIKPVMSYLEHNRLNTDSIYVYYGAQYAFYYYAPMYDLEESDYVISISSRQKPKKYIQDIDKLLGKERVWVLFSHNCSWCLVDERAFILDRFDEIGTKTDEIESINASAHLYDLSLKNP